MNLVVQLLISFLQEDPSQLKSLPIILRKLHEFSLQRLHSMGPLYPEDLKRVLENFPQQKSKLELALRTNAMGVGGVSRQISTDQKTAENSVVEPTIKLTMDFSGFTKKS